MILLGGVVLGLAVLVNFLFIVNKLKKGRALDAATDVAILMAASSIYGMSLMGGISATFGSMFISIYLHYFPLIKPKSEETKTPESSGSTLEKLAKRIDSLFEQ